MSTEKGDEVFAQKTRELWKKIAVHGFVQKNEKTGKNFITNYSDLDGKTALKILQLAKIDTSKVEYLAQGSWKEGYINVDTGDQYGVVVDNKTAFFDHHGKIMLGTATSAAQLVYETMVGLKLIDRTPALDKMINFVTQMDNKTFPDEERYYQDSDRTMLGLQGFVKPETLLQFFKDNKNPTKRLTDQELRRYGLDRRSKEMSAKLTKSEEEFRKARIIETARYGKVVIDDGKKIPLGFNTALANGCDSYVNWSPDINEFKIYTKADLPNDFLLQGEKQRGKMWIKPSHDNQPLTVTLDDVIGALKS